VTTEASAETHPVISRVGPQLIVASALASTLGIVIAQFLDDLGDGILALILGGSDGVMFNNRVEFTGATDLAWAGGFALCLIVGLFALFIYPTQRGHGVSRLVLLWMLLHVLRQALAQAIVLPFSDQSQLALAYDTFEAPAGLDMVIAAGGAVGLLLIALSAASAFLAFTPHRRHTSTSRKRLVFVLWIALIPAVASAFLAIPYFLPDSQGLVVAGLPLVAVMFLFTLAAAPGTNTVIGPEEEHHMPWAWGLASFLLVLLVFFLAVLEGGVSIDPRQWG
jgi:GNAT superfamily N-acetyltransferase